MPTREFSKDFLDEAIYDAVTDEIVDQRRWTTLHEIVFPVDGKFYRTCYEHGSTEYQEVEDQFPGQPDPVPCVEVHEVEVVTKQYVSLPDDE